MLSIHLLQCMQRNKDQNYGVLDIQIREGGTVC